MTYPSRTCRIGDRHGGTGQSYQNRTLAFLGDGLAHPGAPTDVTVPDMFKSEDPSAAERGMAGFATAAGGPPIAVLLNRSGGT
jgi:hypothetical protein